MPFKSKHQMQWFKENKPELYDEMFSKTKKPDKLPNKVKAKKNPKSKR